MPNYKLIIEYDGTDLSGWQKQKNILTAQEILENALSNLFEDVSDLTASGRTDAGVHALGQVVSFKSKKIFDSHTLTNALNFYLIGKPLVVIQSEIMDKKFNARFSSKKRHYRYIILNRKSRSVIDENRVWHISQKLKLKAMRSAAQYLIGKHDFSSFRASECQSKSPIKTLDEIIIKKSGEKIFIDVSAKSFLHHMVRNIVGTIVEAGRGNITPEEVKNILEAKDRRKAKQTAPACGLYFIRVDY